MTGGSGYPSRGCTADPCERLRASRDTCARHRTRARSVWNGREPGRRGPDRRPLLDHCPNTTTSSLIGCNNLSRGLHAIRRHWKSLRCEQGPSKGSGSGRAHRHFLAIHDFASKEVLWFVIAVVFLENFGPSAVSREIRFRRHRPRIQPRMPWYPCRRFFAALTFHRLQMISKQAAAEWELHC